LPSMHEALGLIPSTEGEKKKKEETAVLQSLSRACPQWPSYLLLGPTFKGSNTSQQCHSGDQSSNTWDSREHSTPKL
jgi:hypothetical protein